MVEKLREELHKLIDQYGIQDKRVLKKSQELDMAINEGG